MVTVEYCNCENVGLVARDMDSTCAVCGGIDAYKSSTRRLAGLPAKSFKELYDKQCAKEIAPTLYKFEQNYADIVKDIIENGTDIKGRNGMVRKTFGQVLDIDMKEGKFPMLIGRKLWSKSVVGEFVTLFNGNITNVKQFKENGCDYWDLWKDNEDGDIRLDYGNLWRDWEGVDQLVEVVNTIKTDPNDRRMLLFTWRPSHVIKKELSLPCCHYGMQFSVDNSKLSMIWHQRSADFMVGVPADIQLAALMLATIATECKLKVGKIKMVFGDSHIYHSHLENVRTYLNQYEAITHSHTFLNDSDGAYPDYEIYPHRISLSNDLKTDFIKIKNYLSGGVIKFKLEA